jgi:ABC-type antimicrobial peptide transport system permease subunit
MKLSVTHVSSGNILKIAVFCNVLPYIGDNITEILAVCIVRDIKALQSVGTYIPHYLTSYPGTL